ncbi:PREDICTED: MICAL-like protein 1 isoform X1 [Branchiostoma belcheri]|uniref:MICAL-like protein 1 isoform X1 n=1 Tax=Branchiostoma belcheri TaxID=7741 RepID=A0A6P4Y7Y6_BRABE|nr:PREDICTED: MICAL-like protein 1 isoform X1 [Branchiostoma belcheri]
MAGAAAKGLREWAKQVTAGYAGVSVTNLTTSWRDGMAFCAIIHHFRPDLIDFGSLSKENIRENNKLAFDVAEQELGIPALLDPADMVALKVPDKLSIMTYLSQLYNFFSGPGLGGASKGGVKRPPASLSPAHGTKKSKALDDDDNPFKAYLAQEPVVQETNKTEDYRRHKRTPSPSNFSKSQLSSLKTSLKEDIEQFMPAEVVQRSDRSCSVCDKYVHIVEKVFVDGKMYHRNCFRCSICKVSLKAGAYKDGGAPGELICSRHNQIAEYRTPEPEKPKPAQEKLPETPPEVGVTVDEAPSVAAKARARFFEEQAQQNSDEAGADPFAKRSAQKAKQEAEDKENKNMLPGILKNIADAKRKNQAKQVVEEPPPAKPPRSPHGLKNDNGNNNSPPAPRKDLNHGDVVMADVAELTPPPRRKKSDKTKKTKEGDRSKSPAPPSPKVQPVAPKSGPVPTKTDAVPTKTDAVPTKTDTVATKTNAVPMKTNAVTPKVDIKDTKQPEKLKPQEADTTKPPRDASPKPAERKAPKPRPRKAPGENGSDASAPLEAPKPKPRPRSAELLAEPVAKPPTDSYPEDKNPFEDEPSPTEVQSQVLEKVAVEAKSGSPEKVPVKEEPKIPSSVETKSKDARLAEPKHRETTNQPKQEQKSPPQPKPEQSSQLSEESKAPQQKPEPATVKPATEAPPAETSRPERANPFDTKPSDRPNPFDTKPPERKLTRLKCSLNPFDEPSDEEEEDSRSDSLNPFDISDDDLSDVDLDEPGPDDAGPPAARVPEGPVEPQRRSAFPEVKRKKKRRAPAPPGTKPGLPPVMAVKPQPSVRGEKEADISAPDQEGSPQKVQKKRRAPAPPVYRRQINSKNRVPQEEIDQELQELEKQLTELEHRGVKLEIMLRHGMASTIAGEDEDELLSDWFSLVNEKNKLVRRETELVYITRQQSLEDQQANVEYELRCLMQISEEKKSMGEKSREARLLNELLEIVAERNSIVDSLDEDRIREEEEDRDIQAMMADKGALSAPPPQPEEQEPAKERRGRGLFGKKDKKDKEKDKEKAKRKPKVQI